MKCLRDLDTGAVAQVEIQECAHQNRGIGSARSFGGVVLEDIEARRA